VAERKMVVGLGNPGENYRNTRHNFGSMCVDGIVKMYGLDSKKSKSSAEVFCGRIEGYEVMVVKPGTFMNNSGVAVKQLKLFYRIPDGSIFVFHDDLDLKLCRVKLKTGGNDGGHRGVKSIDEMIGKNYNRVRLGIGRPEEKGKVADFVLEKFIPEEMEKVQETIDRISDAVPELFTRKENFINRLIYS
jgi:PTH1 family peptidyl-tRNA hydrolase